MSRLQYLHVLFFLTMFYSSDKRCPGQGESTTKNCKKQSFEDIKTNDPEQTCAMQTKQSV